MTLVRDVHEHEQEPTMPWVRRHRRHVPYSWFRTTTVQSHYRRSPATIPTIIAVALAVILLLVVIF
ncbi:hypothetical protein ALI22I_24795 [Saccharothrix sp. ALI-22-I]|nr:hypothetical protein ALI22I_24795 [Saccharothrix sp. ALI-22-I]